jgi:translation initiation factor IF-3
MLGVMTTRDAQRMAEQQGLDLVEISPTADPPVCKIMDFGRFRYEESTRRKQARKNQSRQQIKEVKFHAGVEEHDLQTKLKHIRGFLTDGDKVKITLQYRGRENAHKELGMAVVTRVVKECEPMAIVEQQPRLIGRLLGCMLAPRPAKPGSQPKASSEAPRPAVPRPPRPVVVPPPGNPAAATPAAPAGVPSDTPPVGTPVPSAPPQAASTPAAAPVEPPVPPTPVDPVP